MTYTLRSFVGKVSAYDSEEIILSNPVMSTSTAVGTLKKSREFMNFLEAIAFNRYQAMQNTWDQDLGTRLQKFSVGGMKHDSNIAVDVASQQSSTRFTDQDLPTLGIGWPFAVSHVNAKLDEFTELPHGWDSYAGKPTSRAIANLASAWFSTVHELSLPTPQVVPCGDGGVQLEWHIGGLHVEIYFHTDSSIGYWFESDVTGQTGEGELPNGKVELESALSSLRKCDVIGLR